MGSTQLRSLSLSKGRCVEGSLAAIFIAILLTACGENTTTEKIVEVASGGTEIVESVKDLPKCTKDNQGEQALVKGESSVRVCVDGKWFATKESAKDTVFLAGDTVVVAGDTVYLNGGDFSCTTKELKDGSGIKIVCNGDSIGVVLNGAKGDKGDAGADGKNGTDGKNGVGCSIAAQTDSSAIIKCGDKSMTLNLQTGGAVVDTTSSDTLELDSEKVAISMDSLAGYSQKGPFLTGSRVYLYELTDGRTLKQTNGNFTSEITSDDGRYKFNSRNLVSQYALLVVDGKYRNEITGQPTNTSIQLQAYTNMLMRKSANVNLLTHLEKERVFYLVTKEKMTVRAAKRQAQAEILAAFHIDASQIKAESEDLDVFGKTDADAALLAISILLQRDSSETELSVLLTNMANDLAEDGTWDNAVKRAEIADWAATMDSSVSTSTSSLASFRSNVSKWKIGGGNVPDFEKYIRKFWSEELGLGVCGSDSIPVGLVKNVPNKKSIKYYVKNYTDVISVGGNVRFICDDTSLSRWRAATDIEKDTLGWGHKYIEGDVKNGKVNTGRTYVYEDKNWRYGTEIDSLLFKAGGEGCVKNGDTSIVKANNLYYVCTLQSSGDVPRKWIAASDYYNDTYESRKECSAEGKYGDGTVLVGRVNKDRMYVCDDGKFRLANKNLETVLNRGCVSYNMNRSENLGVLRSSYTCTSEGWVFDSVNVITDPRDKQVYKVVKIGSQYWMRENLNYEVENSFCYDNSADSCAKYGRLYAWTAAVDSAGFYSNSAKGCGLGTTCSMVYPVQGICPEGWHIPATNEWDTLFAFVGGKSVASKVLRSQIGWKKNEEDGGGLDDFAFSALPAGRYFIGDQFDYVGNYANFWSATPVLQKGKVSQVNFIFMSALAENISVGSGTKGDAFSVRCIKNIQ